MRILAIILTSLLLTMGSVQAAVINQQVKLETSQGNIIIELDMTRAPVTVLNFLNYVRSGFYDGTIFHRVIDGFMIQGGGFTPAMVRKPTNAPIKNEADNGLKNIRGSIAMARTNDPNSATAQFFINVADNSFLDFKSKTTRGWGYAVFGHVIKGMDVVDKIKNLRTGPGGPFPRDVPLTTVIINKVSVVGAEQPEKMKK